MTAALAAWTQEEPRALLDAFRPRSVAVFRALQLGDMLCAVPALRALREALPTSRIVLIGLPWARQFAARFHEYIDDFIAFPGYPGMPEAKPELPAYQSFLRTVHEEQFDLALQLHGSGAISNLVVQQFGARHVVGFGPGRHSQFQSGSIPFPEQGSEVSRLSALTNFIGAHVDDLRLTFPITNDDRAELHASGVAEGLLPKDYVCIHPGALAENRRWPPEMFARIADTLQRETCLQVVVTGSEQEWDLTSSVIEAMETPAINAASPISIGAMAALLNDARLLISNDTGVSHIAAGLKLPSVVIFRASEVSRWAPLDQDLHHVVVDPDATRAQAVLDHARILLAQWSLP